MTLKPLLLAASLALLSTPAQAAPRRPPASPASTKTVTAVYEGRLLVKLFTARSDFILGAGDYRTGVRASSSPTVNHIKPFNVLAQSQGTFRGGLPASATFVQSAGRKRRVVDFRNRPAGFGMDPVSLLLRIGMSRGPCIGAITAFDGKQKYRVTFSDAAPVALTAQERSWGLANATRCRLTFTPLAGFGKPKSSGPGLLRDDTSAVFAHSAAANLWIMSRVEIATWVGQGRVALTSLKVSDARAPPR